MNFTNECVKCLFKPNAMLKWVPLYLHVAKKLSAVWLLYVVTDRVGGNVSCDMHTISSTHNWLHLLQTVDYIAGMNKEY